MHLFCALMVPGILFTDPEHLDGVTLKHVDHRVSVSECYAVVFDSSHRRVAWRSFLLQRFKKLHCYLCRKQGGACIQCEDCYKAYHPMCAQKNNCYFTWREVDGAVVRTLLGRG